MFVTESEFGGDSMPGLFSRRAKLPPLEVDHAPAALSPSEYLGHIFATPATDDSAQQPEIVVDLSSPGESAATFQPTGEPIAAPDGADGSVTASTGLDFPPPVIDLSAPAAPVAFAPPAPNAQVLPAGDLPDGLDPLMAPPAFPAAIVLPTAPRTDATNS